MSTVYLMNLYGHDIVSPWEECKAKTLKTAKREAWTRFKGGYHHHRIKTAAIQDALERMSYGLEACDDPECDYCHPED
jgi:predicted secreted Zn-dependent protease